MTDWTLEHRIFVYDTFVKCNESVTTVQREFRRYFNINRNDSVPSRDTILRWVNNLRTQGSLLKKTPPGRMREVRTQQNIDRVREAVERSPDRSVRRQAVAMGISDRTMRRILHEDLNFHPYKMAIVNELNTNDYPQRLKFAQDMLALYENEDLKIAMSDEAHFHLNGSVNKQNCRYWSSENPRLTHETPLHSPKVTVWCAVGRFGIIGPYFFEEGGVTVTVTSERYVNMVKTFLIPELRRRRLNRRSLWFQQDGATAHTATKTISVLRELFPNRLISKSGDIVWPPRSPDLSICDFFLWGWLKSLVYKDKPRTLDELKNSIRNQIASVGVNMLERVETNFQERLRCCVKENGHHMSDVIFHS